MKRLTTIALMAIISATLVTGCGKNPEKEKQAESIVLPSSTSSVAETPETDITGTDQQTVTANADSETLYMNYIKNGEGLVTAPDNNRIYSSAGDYSFDDLLDMVSKNIELFDTYHIEGIKYSLIDCGLDGNKELAVTCDVCCDDDGRDEFFQPTLIIKDFGGQLKLIDVELTYYRFWTDINQAGYVVYAGSGGAALFVNTIKYIDKDGNVSHVYTMDGNNGLPRAEIPSSYLPEDLQYDQDWSDGDSYYECDAYNFEEFNWDDSKGYEAEYEAYLEEYRNKYFFAFIDPSENYVIPDDITCEKYDSHDITYYDGNQLDSVLKSREAEFGITDEIKNAGEIEWTELD